MRCGKSFITNWQWYLSQKSSGHFLLLLDLCQFIMLMFLYFLFLLMVRIVGIGYESGMGFLLLWSPVGAVQLPSFYKLRLVRLLLRTSLFFALIVGKSVFQAWNDTAAYLGKFQHPIKALVKVLIAFLFIIQWLLLATFCFGRTSLSFTIHSFSAWFSPEVTIQSYDLVLALIVVYYEMSKTVFWNRGIHCTKILDPHDLLNIESIFLIE